MLFELSNQHSLAGKMSRTNKQSYPRTFSGPECVMELCSGAILVGMSESEKIAVEILVSA